jgi:G3E family GTPase
LITGFLGSGKTTFLKMYVNYLLSKGLKVGIIENDYGAVNVDMMLLSELMDSGCEVETIAGACDLDCHKRRFKTKLIAMGMQNFDRVVIEPSGIFDADEFFDILHEDPLDRWFEIGSVIAIADVLTDDNTSDNSSYISASQTANAGVVIFSKTQLTDKNRINAKIKEINSALKKAKCERILNADEIIAKDWNDINADDFERIRTCGYKIHDYEKSNTEDAYNSVYFLNQSFTADRIKAISEKLFSNKNLGKIYRIKGFFKENGQWFELNATENQFDLQPIKIGQDVVIIIGEKLDEEKIRKEMNYGTKN